MINEEGDMNALEKVVLAIGIFGLINMAGVLAVGLIAGYSYIFTGHTLWLVADANRCGIWLAMSSLTIVLALVAGMVAEEL